jgi:hypothetical protein
MPKRTHLPLELTLITSYNQAKQSGGVGTGRISCASIRNLEHGYLFEHLLSAGLFVADKWVRPVGHFYCRE